MGRGEPRLLPVRPGGESYVVAGGSVSGHFAGHLWRGAGTGQAQGAPALAATFRQGQSCLEDHAWHSGIKTVSENE